MSTPTGAVISFGGASVPAGWLMCDGAPVSRTTYASLFAILGTVYGPGMARLPSTCLIWSTGRWWVLETLRRSLRPCLAMLAVLTTTRLRPRNFLRINTRMLTAPAIETLLPVVALLIAEQVRCLRLAGALLIPMFNRIWPSSIALRHRRNREHY